MPAPISACLWVLTCLLGSAVPDRTFCSVTSVSSTLLQKWLIVQDRSRRIGTARVGPPPRPGRTALRDQHRPREQPRRAVARAPPASPRHAARGRSRGRRLGELRLPGGTRG